MYLKKTTLFTRPRTCNMNDKRLTDRGWRAMKALLDEHMPAPRRRRRPVVALWWLWLLLAGIAGGLWRHYRAAQVPPAAPLPLERTAQMPVAEVPPPAAGPEAGPHPSEHPAASLPQSAPGALPGLGRYARPSASAAVSVHRSTMNAEIVPLLRSDGEVAHHPMAEPTPLEALETVEFAAAPSARPLALLPVLLPALPLSARPLPLCPASTGQTLTSPTPGAKRLSAGLTVGAFAQPGAEARGLVIGPTFDWNAGRQWGLRTGLGYRFTHLYGNGLTASNTAYLESADLVRLSPGALPSKADGIWVRLSHMHRLEVPVLLYGQMTPRLRLYGGGMGGVLLAARVREAPPASGSAQNFDASEIRQLSDLASARLFRWEGSAVAGAGYTLSRRFEVSIQAHWRFFASPSGQTSAMRGAVTPQPNPFPSDKSDRLLLQLSLLGKIH